MNFWMKREVVISGPVYEALAFISTIDLKRPSFYSFFSSVCSKPKKRWWFFLNFLIYKDANKWGEAQDISAFKQ